MASLIISATVLSGLLLITMLFYMRTRESYAGFGHWTLGVCFITIGHALNIFRGLIPDAVPIITGNTLFILAMILFLQGMIKFLDLPAMNPAWYIFPVINFAACSVYYYIWDDVVMRIIFFAATMAVPQLYTAWLVFRHMLKEKFIFFPVIAVEMTIASLLIIFRAGWIGSVEDFTFFMESPYQSFFFISTMALQVIICLSFIMLNSERLYSQLKAAKEELRIKMEELEQSISEVKVLSGLLPICSNCKKIRDENEHWIAMESYIRARSEADFSHGICPECLKKLYPDYWNKI